VTLLIENVRRPDGAPVRLELEGSVDLRIDGHGGTLLPGLHDHHIHLLSLAARRSSLDLSAVASVEELERAVAESRRARPLGWLRATGYRVNVAGEVDRQVLDRMDSSPLRVQDHTGGTWTLNSAALDLVLDGPLPPGVDVTRGRLTRVDDWLRARIGAEPPDVVDVAALLASRGVTAVTDATATNGLGELELLAALDLPFHVTAMTAAPDVTEPAGLRLGPVKVLLDDADLPALDDLARRLVAAHRVGRAAAVHCVTRAQLLLTLAAFDQGGAVPGDRIEHGSVIPAESLPVIARLGLTVTTNPGFIAVRGDTYLDEVDADDQDSLYRVASLHAAGITVQGATDAPFGPEDPWVAIDTAITRRHAPSGRTVGASEAVDRETAVGLFAGPGYVVLNDGEVLATVLDGRTTYLREQ
jgi:predicted amidohydrolase YtcJ